MPCVKVGNAFLRVRGKEEMQSESIFFARRQLEGIMSQLINCLLSMNNDEAVQV